RCVRLGTPPPGLGHAARGPDADRGRRAAGDGLVGRDGHLAPGAPDPGHRGAGVSQTKLPEAHADAPEPERRTGELTLRELGRWTWRQLTSMRTALVLLLLLALVAIP